MPIPTEKDVNPFEIDKSDIALAVPLFLLVNSDHDDDKQDEMDILIVQHFIFWLS